MPKQLITLDTHKDRAVQLVQTLDNLESEGLNTLIELGSIFFNVQKNLKAYFPPKKGETSKQQFISWARKDCKVSDFRRTSALDAYEMKNLMGITFVRNQTTSTLKEYGPEVRKKATKGTQLLPASERKKNVRKVETKAKAIAKANGRKVPIGSDVNKARREVFGIKGRNGGKRSAKPATKAIEALGRVDLLVDVDEHDVAIAQMYSQQLTLRWEEIEHARSVEEDKKKAS